MLAEDNNMVTNENGGEHEESVTLNKMEEDGKENQFLQFGLLLSSCLLNTVTCFSYISSFGYIFK